MASSSNEVVIEGWLTKSPPTKRIWRAKWRRRWFSLKHSGDIPNQFILTYYVDRNCRQLKGSINLDDCEQVDLGLKLDKKKLKFDHVFDIKTPTRTYYLAADTESDMKSWVNCICKVCGLKSTSDEEDVQLSENTALGGDVVYTVETSEGTTGPNDVSPISPVSTSPYIPIFECFTGKTPVFNSHDIKVLLEQNRKNACKSDNEHANQNYGYALPPSNYVNDYVNNINDPQFYDSPRDLVPKNDENDLNSTKRSSPLQSPTDTDSVFTDDDNNHDLDVSVSQKFIKNRPPTKIAPPRPPKSSLIVPNTQNYMNLQPIMDETYDFPRSHQSEADMVRNTLQRRHCYNNAVPVKVEGHVFRYDMSPKPSTSGALANQVFRYDWEELQDEPASPLSQSSGYSNLPSPLLDGQLMLPPPIVDRDLKPKRKLSDSLSSCSNPEPGSPRAAPSIDRKRKPATLLQDIRKTFAEESRGVAKRSPTLLQTRKTSSVDEDNRRSIRKEQEKSRRAGPSPLSPGLRHSHESLLHQNSFDKLYYKEIQYLDLNLSSKNYTESTMNTLLSNPSNKNNTDYKIIDIEKTQALKSTKNCLEKERKAPVKFCKK